VPLLGLPADPRPLLPLPLPDEVDPDDPKLPLLEGEGDPLLLEEVDPYTSDVSIEPVTINAAKTRHKATLTEYRIRIIF